MKSVALHVSIARGADHNLSRAKFILKFCVIGEQSFSRIPAMTLAFVKKTEAGNVPCSID